MIPEVPKPEYGRTSSAAAAAAVPQRKGKEDPLEQLIPERRYGREAPKYNPQQQQSQAGYGSYGNYGNYGNYGSAAGAGGSQLQPQQQQYGGGADSRGELFKGAKPPSSRMGAGFDDYAGSNKKAGGYGASASGSRPDYADGGDDDLNGSNDRDDNDSQQQQGDEEEDEV